MLINLHNHIGMCSIAVLLVFGCVGVMYGAADDQQTLQRDQERVRAVLDYLDSVAQTMKGQQESIVAAEQLVNECDKEKGSIENTLKQVQEQLKTATDERALCVASSALSSTMVDRDRMQQEMTSACDQRVQQLEQRYGEKETAYSLERAENQRITKQQAAEIKQLKQQLNEVVVSRFAVADDLAKSLNDIFRTWYDVLDAFGRLRDAVQASLRVQAQTSSRATGSSAGQKSAERLANPTLPITNAQNDIVAGAKKIRPLLDKVAAQKDTLAPLYKEWLVQIERFVDQWAPSVVLKKPATGLSTEEQLVNKILELKKVREEFPDDTRDVDKELKPLVQKRLQQINQKLGLGGGGDKGKLEQEKQQLEALLLEFGS